MLPSTAATMARPLPLFADPYAGALLSSSPTLHRVEPLNLCVKRIKRLSGFGFRRFDNYRLRVLYRCG